MPKSHAGKVVRMRATQKKLLLQREEARAEVEPLKTELERLRTDMHAAVAEETRKVEETCNAAVRAAEHARDAAVRERDALLKDFDNAIAVRLDETQKELVSTKTRLNMAQKEVIGLVGRNGALSNAVALSNEAVESHKADVAKLTEELSTLKMEDTKQLRRRLQTKTERVAELERELILAKRAPVAAAVPAIPGLSALLNAKLRRKLKQDGQLPTDLEEPAVPAPEAMPESTMFGGGNSSNPPPARHIP